MRKMAPDWSQKCNAGVAEERGLPIVIVDGEALENNTLKQELIDYKTKKVNTALEKLTCAVDLQGTLRTRAFSLLTSYARSLDYRLKEVLEATDNADDLVRPAHPSPEPASLYCKIWK